MDSSVIAEFTLGLVALHDWIINVESSSGLEVPIPTKQATHRRPVALINQDLGKSVRYPEKLLKELEFRLKCIAKGEDKKFKGDRFRRTAAVFWGNWSDAVWIKRMKDSRKLEDLLLAFASAVMKVVDRSPDIPSSERNLELDRQLERFFELLQDIVKVHFSTAKEILDRLQRYSTWDEPQDDAPSHSITQPVASVDLLTSTAQKLFVDVDLSLEMDELINGFTSWYEGKLETLAQALASEDSGDFLDRDARDSRCLQEQTALETLLDRIHRAKTSDPNYSKAVSFRLKPALSSHTFKAATPRIPDDTRELYAALVHVCAECDLQAMAEMPGTEFVSPSVISAANRKLLQQCALFWAVTAEFGDLVSVGYVNRLFDQDDVPAASLLEELSHLWTVLETTNLSLWYESDISGLIQLVYDIVGPAAEKSCKFLENYDTGNSDESDELYSCLAILDQAAYLSSNVDSIRNTSLASDIQSRVVSLRRALIKAAELRYENSTRQRSERWSGGAEDLSHIASWIQAQAKKLNKRFPEPLTASSVEIDVVTTVLECFLPRFQSDLVAWSSSSATSHAREEASSLVFDLYHKCEKIFKLRDAFCPSLDLSPQPVTLFSAYVTDWLQSLLHSVTLWVENAVKLDSVSLPALFAEVGAEPKFPSGFHTKFQPDNENGTSSSVTDIFDSVRSAATILSDLRWPDRAQYADFVAGLSMVAGHAVKLYGRTLRDDFEQQLSQTSPANQDIAADPAWLTRARRSLRGPTVPSPFHFSVESCVMLNDIEMTMQQFDRLYYDFELDKWHSGRSPFNESGIKIKRSAQASHLFSVKVKSMDLEADEAEDRLICQVIISDQQGNSLLETRLIEGASVAHWDETLDISVQQKIWLMASVSILDGGNQSNLGRAYFKLDPEYFQELVPRDLWLPLDIQGKLLLGIGMETEKEDGQFIFGRGFRQLQQTHNQMTQQFVDKMMPTVTKSLSRQTVKALLRPRQVGISLANGALGRISAAYKLAANAAPDSIIPPAFPDRSSTSQLSDVNIENAIGPLLDYFDANLSVLSQSLSSANLQAVLTRLWKEILGVVEGLIVPPLSSSPSSMRPLTDQELDIVLKWLRFLRDFFHAQEGKGVPLEELQNYGYNDILRIRIYYDWRTDDLMEECVKDFQSSLRSSALARPRAKTIRAQRNLGTIRESRAAKRKVVYRGTAGEMIMRVLRMRAGTTEFLKDQIGMLRAQRSNA